MTRLTTFVLALALLLTGCSSCGTWWSSTGQPAAAAALDCTETALSSQSGAIVGSVVTLLEGGKPDMTSELLKLGTTAGQAALACAVQAANHVLVGKAASTTARAMADEPAQAAVARARTFARAQGFTYKGL